MDFHCLPRRELQALCKKNRIPANMTNVAMADALQSLFAVGGMESIEEALQNQSPKNVQASSAYLPRSSRRISARRAAASTASDDPKEQPASPLPRARRVTAMDSETGRLFSEEVDRDEEQKEGMMEITPMAKPSTKKQPRGTTTVRYTRRRATKKEDGDAAEDGLIEAAKTPAPRNGRRTIARKEAESPAVVDEGTEDTVVSSRTTTRRARQSSKSIPVDVTATTLRRSSRARARVSVPDMESLAQDVEEQAEKGIEIKKSVDTEGDSMIPPPCKKSSDMAAGNVTDLKEIQDKTVIDGDNCGQDCNPVVADCDLSQHHHSSEVKEDGVVPETDGVDDVKDGDSSIASCKKTSDLAEENATDLREAEGIQDNTLIGSENCEQDCRPVVVDIDLSQRQHSSEINEDGIVSETEGLDDVKDGDSLIASCKNTSDLATETEGIQDETIIDGENCERDCNLVVVDTDPSQHQQSPEVEEDGIVPETEGLNEVNESEIAAQQHDVETGVETMDLVDRDGAFLLLSDEKPSDLAAGNASHLCSMDSQEEILPSEICEQDCNVADDITNLVASLLLSDEKSSNLAVANASHLSSMDSQEKLEKESNGDQEEILPSEICEQDCNVSVVDTNLPLHQLVADPKEPEGFDVESSPKMEGGCVGDQMANQADNTNLPLHQLAVEPKEPEGFNAELSPQKKGGREEEQTANQADRESSVLEVTPLISSLGNPDITGDAADEQSQREEEETEDEMQTYSAPKNDDETSDGDETVAEVVSFSPQQKPTSSHRSNTVDLPAESLPEVGDIIGDSEVSPDAVTVEVVEAAKLSKVGNAEDSVGALMATAIIVEVEKSENRKESDADEEKKSFGQLTMTEIGCGEAKVESDAEKQSLPVVDLQNMSLRKLKLLYKEKKSNAKATNKGACYRLSEPSPNIRLGVRPSPVSAADLRIRYRGIQMAEEKQRSLLLDSASRFPLPHGARFSYGTAGFRSEGSILASTVYRAGVLAALRSLKTGSAIGLMITASHNPLSDNGVKIADPDGGMMIQRWEPFADALANAPDSEHLLHLVVRFVEEENIPFGGVQSAEVLLGRDTRPSGEALLEAAKHGINAIIGAVAIDMGVLTTPQLHWMVRSRNKGMVASESDYSAQVSKSFRCLMDLVPRERIADSLDTELVVDGANGVGGDKLEQLKKMVTGLDISVKNTGKKGEGMLNESCGADYVQKEKVVPSGFGPDYVGVRCASLDGDADRLVYFLIPSASSKNIDLIDGDKILSLFAVFIKEQLDVLYKGSDSNNKPPVRLGIVQTAYANGASTAYLKWLGLEVVFTPTGVKYLHKKAAEYDIGIYFEANGHGTVLFSENFLSGLECRSNELASASSGSEQHKAALRLLAVSQLINQAVGDALSGLLLVEAVLQYMGWSIKRWNELYQDLPSRQLKVKVADRNAVVTANAETQVVKPSGLQELIDAESGKHPHGRCFIRPSGTEDIIRVYAEASTQEAADSLARSIVQLVDRVLGSGNSHQ
ncbi:unnamed protein product [Musa banksii]